MFLSAIRRHSVKLLLMFQVFTVYPPIKQQLQVSAQQGTIVQGVSPHLTQQSIDVPRALIVQLEVHNPLSVTDPHTKMKFKQALVRRVHRGNIATHLSHQLPTPQALSPRFPAHKDTIVPLEQEPAMRTLVLQVPMVIQQIKNLLVSFFLLLLFFALYQTFPTLYDPKEESCLEALQEKEKILVTCIFTFEHSAFKSLNHVNIQEKSIINSLTGGGKSSQPIT